MTHEEEGAGDQDSEARRKERTFTMYCVDRRSSRSLHGDRYQPPEG